MASVEELKIKPRIKIVDCLILTGHISIVLAAFFVAISISLTHIFILVAAALSVLSGLFWSRLKWVLTHPLSLPIVLLLLLVTAGLFWSLAPWADRLSSLHKYAKLLYIPFLLPLCMDAKWREYAISAFLCAVGITVSLSFFKAYAGLSFGEYPMSSWIFHSHIETSYFVAFATYIFAIRACKKNQYTWLYCVLAAVFTYQEFFINDGRTGWSVYFLLLLIFFVQYCPIKLAAKKSSPRGFSIFLQKYRWLFGMLVVFLLSIGIYSTSAIFRAQVNNSLQGVEEYIAVGQSASHEYRLGFVQLSLALVKHHPIFGLGTGSFQTAYNLAGGIPNWGPKLNNPHNEYLLILVQLGLCGLLALLFFFYQQWRSSLSLGKNKFAAQALLLSFMLACCYNAFLYTTVTGHFYIVFSSILFGAYPGTAKGVEKNLCSSIASDGKTQ